MYDYQYDDDPEYTDEDLRFYTCQCGAPKCRGTIVETRKKLHEVSALRALLDGIVDYAGLFPPAALDMSTAVRNYASYSARSPTRGCSGGSSCRSRGSTSSTARAALPARPSDRGGSRALLGADIEADVAARTRVQRVARGRARSIDVARGQG